ncbi:techylectin-5B-like [Lineus longissimus]|uniref:techylectin-5B-like n=1 Tax=Lineus longissimus TaxID=88925 RepID=UPI00315DF1FD
MACVQFYISTLTFSYLAITSQSTKLLDAFGSKFFTLPGCTANWGMSSANIDDTSNGTYLDCARKCKGMFEECGWMNFKENTTADNCEFGNTPRDVGCSDLEQKTGTKFYFKERFCYYNSTYDRGENKCEPCPPAYTGQRCNIRAYDCSDYFHVHVYDTTPAKTKIKYIWPENSTEPFEVKCRLHKSGGTTVIMFQGKAIDADNFSMNVTWVNYTNGFGLRQRDFYIGNKFIHEIVSGSRIYGLRIWLGAFLNKTFNVNCVYDNFHIGNESERFRITMKPSSQNKRKWHGDVLFSGDNATETNGSYFSTYDRDNDGNATFNCAQNFGGGWWFGTGCSEANVNGPRILNYSNWSPTAWPQLSWGSAVADETGFKMAEMKVFPHPHKAPNYRLVI